MGLYYFYNFLWSIIISKRNIEKHHCINKKNKHFSAYLNHTIRRLITLLYKVSLDYQKPVVIHNGSKDVKQRLNFSPYVWCIVDKKLQCWLNFSLENMTWITLGPSLKTFLIFLCICDHLCICPIHMQEQKKWMMSFPGSLIWSFKRIDHVLRKPNSAALWLHDLKQFILHMLISNFSSIRQGCNYTY